MLKIIKNLVNKFRTKREMDIVSFSKIYGAYAGDYSYLLGSR